MTCSLQRVIEPGNGIVVEPSALGMAAKRSTEIENSSINGWNDQN